MDLSFTPEQIAFRDEVRAWIREAMPPRIREKADVDGHFDHDEIMEWHRILYAKGWVAPHWPAEWGGAGLDVTRRFILTEELELAGAPGLSPFGLTMVGPLILQFGSDAQRRRFLPKILAGEEVWCQGYSEPNAGSDLASLKLSAEPDGKGNYVLNGQKTWTTYAQYADWIFVLARTDKTAKKQSGISFFLVDMKAPGVTARPTLTIAGTLAFCDTFFENVVVPAENLVGPLHGGWTLAKALLGHERTYIAAVGLSTRMLRRVKCIAAATKEKGVPLIEVPSWRARIARMEIELWALKMANYRAIASAELGHAPGAESSILKIRGSEIMQQMYELAMDLMGHDSLSWHNEPGTVPEGCASIPPQFNYTRAASIYGGSNEIQKNVIAKAILGLPS
ncbi:acyl-CoA dehydrogenase family protein [Polyangium jinanense]|uniref:Acyl-CoA dehydrogenase family protein n=1 Tax=Polyangium jinanense TaxID=2829994 RepID=A0A9X4AU94_9BACT|nr:acyl-CoA dehydrogenase family protein [Polyangium jinanense]MDC3956148.1 acyl-CoA dehydrogenase family protein [Polyangium jinanense]MDC3983017.1 acyl-CoA dehydrogenase family protein [Polyangium jinanense]